MYYVVHWVIQGREFMTNFIWQLLQGREFTTNCSFYFFFLPLFHLLKLGCSQSTCTVYRVRTFVHERTYIMTPHVQYVSVCVQREITLNSGKEISAPQIIQGREFTTRDITSFTYQVMCWREFTISRLFFFFLSFLIIFSLSFPLISLPCFWFFYFFSPPLRGGGNARIYAPV